jgi:hypothetical protein
VCGDADLLVGDVKPELRQPVPLAAERHGDGVRV